MLLPATEADLADMLRAAAAPLLIQGNGTKAAMLRPVQAADTLSTTAMTGITLYAPNELVMSARAGTRLSEIESALAAAGQQMIAEPGHMFGPNQTIGGIVGANLSGPRRITGGAMRDHMLGVRAVNGAGEILNFGGRVLKNVTGLDIPKLLTGSFGTLAVLTEVTFKVLPVAEATGTIVLEGLDGDAAVKALSAGLGSPFGVSAAAYLPAARRAYLRIEEFAASVTYRCEKLGRELGASEILGTADSLALWADIRDAGPLAAAQALWRVSVPPSAGPGILASLAPLGIEGFLDWGGGLVWLGGAGNEPNHLAITRAATQAGGVWWLMRAPESLRAAVDVLPPEAPALAAISRRVRHSFDPRGILNPLKLRAA